MRMELRPIERQVLEVFRDFENYWYAKEGDDLVPDINEYLKYSAVVGRRQLPFARETMSFMNVSDGGEGGIRHLIAIFRNSMVDTVIMRYEDYTQMIFNRDSGGTGRLITGDER